jgi:hypothetical protein
LPDAVKVPASNSVMMETMTAGAVIRQCRANKDMAGQYEWAFVGLDAGLRNRAGKVVGRYYGPPATWESVDGSNVTGTQVAVVPTDTGNISFQLVKANPAMGMGAIQGVRYIQHVKTGGGGVAPQSGCTAATLSQKQNLTYTADYIFWRAMQI